ncbi:MAG TPA: methyltransferase domain-containing protein [Candidatus Paceibacterota bacterium]
MKNQKVADYYDKLYSDDEKAFSGEPLPLVKVLVEHISSGDVLEIGAGAGRNSLFLASQGFNVLATDISPQAVEKLKERALESGVNLKAEVSDMAEAKLTQDFDAIICTFSFHHLTAEDAELAIIKIQQHTKPNGFNLFTIFTKEGDFYKKHPDTDNFYLNDKEQLEGLYSDWKIIKSSEKEGKARTLDTEGNPQFNVFVGFLAQKI